MTLADLQELANGLGVVLLLLLILIGGYRQWWVFGWAYKEIKEDSSEWRRLALSGTELVEKAVEKTVSGR